MCLPLQIAILSYEKQERLRRPPLKMSFRPPLQTLSAVVMINHHATSKTSHLNKVKIVSW